MIRNYIFDFGNVLTRFYPDELTAIADEQTQDRISAVVFDRLYWDRLDDGTISEEEVKAGIRSRLPGEYGEIGCHVFEQWIARLVPIEGMPELAADIKAQGGKLYLLSNISVRFANEYAQNPWIDALFSLFDGLVFSGPLGITKPNRAIFEHLLNKYALNAEECLFIDDAERNIIGAKAVGIEGYLFDGDAEKLRKALHIPKR